ncbi:hypothetical protein SISSUDRAFT_886181 [Sistotremastrum suecicum HHB10207 ss-3]|uniref:Uncharacterized protein n=1 Tax=Sistotremastrum suecicum HHB10207 ss-3 TaxID=1314776 RepID=A0A166C6X5_9AGAM|nr:hypothetical protein SISSUDRAFT_886181 [Sistotremastrum suecicum HHB10207 ss-3]
MLRGESIPRKHTMSLGRTIAGCELQALDRMMTTLLMAAVAAVIGLKVREDTLIGVYVLPFDNVRAVSHHMYYFKASTHDYYIICNCIMHACMNMYNQFTLYALSAPQYKAPISSQLPLQQLSITEGRHSERRRKESSPRGR